MTIEELQTNNNKLCCECGTNTEYMYQIDFGCFAMCIYMCGSCLDDLRIEIENSDA